MAAATTDEDVITGINVTPLVDIALVLLIIFMVTARFVVAPSSLPMVLPPASQGVSTQATFGVDLFVNGEMVVDGQRLAQDGDVFPLAKAAFDKDDKVRSVIRADVSVPHGRVIQVLDQLRKAGMTRISFGVSSTSDLSTERSGQK